MFICMLVGRESFGMKKVGHGKKRLGNTGLHFTLHKMTAADNTIYIEYYVK